MNAMVSSGASPSRTFGRYQLVVELGKSWLGTLWAGRDPEGGLFFLRRVRGPEHRDYGGGLEAAFERAAGLYHPNTLAPVEILHFNGEIGIVSQFVHGESLRSLLRLSNFQRRPFPAEVALQIARDLLEGLGQAEATGGLVLGGAAPDQVVIAQDGVARVLEAFLGGPSKLNPPRGETDDALAYQSPEAFDGELTVASDVFSVGAILWEMLAGGRRLFAGTSRDSVVAQIRTLVAPELSGFQLPGGANVAKPVSDLVARALSRDPARRFASFTAMNAAIADLGLNLSHEAVAKFLSELAGKAMSAREKLIGRMEMERPVGRPTASKGKPDPLMHNTLLGMAPAKPADRLRASQMVSYPEVDIHEPSIATSGDFSPIDPESERRIAVELMEALSKEPSQSRASPRPLAPPAPVSRPQLAEGMGAPNRPVAADAASGQGLPSAVSKAPPPPPIRRLSAAEKAQAPSTVPSPASSESAPLPFKPLDEHTEPLSPERIAEIVSRATEGVDSLPARGSAEPGEPQMLGSLMREVLSSPSASAGPLEEGHTEPTRLSPGSALHSVATRIGARTKFFWGVGALAAAALLATAVWLVSGSESVTAENVNVREQVAEGAESKPKDKGEDAQQAAPHGVSALVEPQEPGGETEAQGPSDKSSAEPLSQVARVGLPPVSAPPGRETQAAARVRPAGAGSFKQPGRAARPTSEPRRAASGTAAPHKPATPRPEPTSKPKPRYIPTGI